MLTAVTTSGWAQNAARVEDLIRAGRDAMYKADLETARSSFHAAAVLAPASPAPEAFAGISDLWSMFHFGYSAQFAESLVHHGEVAVQKANDALARARSADGYFWRGMGRSLQL